MKKKCKAQKKRGADESAPRLVRFGRRGSGCKRALLRFDEDLQHLLHARIGVDIYQDMPAVRRFGYKLIAQNFVLAVGRDDGDAAGR